MILPLHILIALMSVAATTYTFVRPSQRRVAASCVLVILTLASGTYLVIATHAPLMQACTTGLVYLASVLMGIGGAYYKLARNAR